MQDKWKGTENVRNGDEVTGICKIFNSSTERIFLA